MKNSFGNNITVTIFGESHGPAIGVTIDGLAPGIKLDLDYIKKRMSQRQAKGRISTQRHEPDELNIISGWFEGRTTGTPLKYEKQRLRKNKIPSAPFSCRLYSVCKI